MEKSDVSTHTLKASDLKGILPERQQDAHKGIFGSVAMIGGDASMVGAVLLAARAAQLTGAGRIYAAMLSGDAPKVDLNHPEIMMRPPAALSQLAQLDAVVIGPGLGQSAIAIQLLQYWLIQQTPLLLDADALNLLALHPPLKEQVASRQIETVITPHVGEAARLLGVTSDYIQQHRVDSALELAKLLKAVCVLKGAGSIIAHYDGGVLINSTGNVGLASGGTGDVLSGVIGSLLAQGLNALDAAKLGVYLHGAAADALVERGVGPIGLTASEVLMEIRQLISQLTSQH